MNTKPYHKPYRILLSGCDDSTSIEIMLSEQEYLIINAIAGKLSAESTYECMPTMSIQEIDKLSDKPNKHEGITVEGEPLREE